jgi:transposase
MPAELTGHTAANSFHRWRRAGMWDRILSALQRQVDERGELVGALRHVGSAVVRAHQLDAGASTKVHLR